VHPRENKVFLQSKLPLASRSVPWQNAQDLSGRTRKKKRPTQKKTATGATTESGSLGENKASRHGDKQEKEANEGRRTDSFVLFKQV